MTQETTLKTFDELEAIAARTGQSLRKLNLYYDLRHFTLMCRLNERGRRVDWNAAHDAFLIEVRVDTTLSLAINGPDLTFGLKYPLDRGANQVRIFLRQGSADAERAWVRLVNAGIVSLGLARGERLTILPNRASFLMSPSGIDVDWNRFQSLLDFVGALPPAPEPPPGSIRGLRLDVQALPPALRSLVPLIVRWAESDDSDRGELIEEASTQDLETLWNHVGPVLDEISAYIDRVAEALPGHSVLLSALCEAALEAELELERRRQ